MAITNQPAEDSLYSAYSQIQVETDQNTEGLDIKVQDLEFGNLVSLNIIDSAETEVISDSSGSNDSYFMGFVIDRKIRPGEYYMLGADQISAPAGSLDNISISFRDATDDGTPGTQFAYTTMTLGSNKSWLFQIPKNAVTSRNKAILLVYAGLVGSTAGKTVTIKGLTLALGVNRIIYRPSKNLVVQAIANKFSIYRDSRFGASKIFDLSFLAKSGFRDPYTLHLYKGVDVYPLLDLNLVSAYAYKPIGGSKWNIRNASRGVVSRMQSPDFSDGNTGYVLTDRVPDNQGNIRFKKYFGYPYGVTLLPQGGSSSYDMHVEVLYSPSEPPGEISIRRNTNFPIVLEFNDEISDQAEWISVKPEGNPFDSRVRNIVFEETEIPCNPFYIRWINRKGGWDMYMFEQHKKYTQEVDRRDQYILANSRDPNTTESRGELAPEVKNIVQAGAEQLDENDFSLLKGIALSPLVQVYNYQIGQWQRVLVDDTDLTWDTKAPRNTVSYEFQLIDEQTQW